MFDSIGYVPKFIQRDTCRDGSAHLATYIFKFYSPITRYLYIIRAEHHEENVFALKFYCKKDRRSSYKYSKLTNRKDVSNILITCARVVPLLLQRHSTSSFGFIAARTIDPASKKVENIFQNQRFVLYRELIQRTFGPETFEHFEYPEISAYMLLNRTTGDDLTSKENCIKRMFAETYPDLLNI